MPGPLSLKQRLQALSTNIANGVQGNSSGDPFSPKSPGPRIRAFLSQNVMRRSQETSAENSNGSGNGHANEQGYSQDRVQEVMSKLIFQAGVDYECVFVFNSSSFCSEYASRCRTRPM